MRTKEGILMLMLAFDHRSIFGHWPEWVGEGGLRACALCVKGGRKERLPRMVRVPQGV